MLFIIENRNLFKKVIGFQRTFFSAHTDCSKLEKLVEVDFYDVIKYMTSDYLQDFLTRRKRDKESIRNIYYDTCQ